MRAHIQSPQRCDARLTLAGEVASGKVIGLFFFQWWDDLTADGLGFPAPGVEITSAGWVHGTGDVAFENDAFAFRLDVGIRHGDC